MDAIVPEEHRKKYTTPRWVQVWFLQRSRDNWKRKYKALKAYAKRMQNRVHDVAVSREKWRQEAAELEKRVQDLEAQNATLQAQMALKKNRPLP